MSDELQDALTSASSDPIEELKQEIGVKEETKATTQDESKSTPEKKETKGDEQSSSDDGESGDTSSDAEAKKDQVPSKKDYQAKKVARQAAANRRQLETINELKQQLEKATANSQDASQGPKKPSMDDFDDYAEYDKALAQYQDDIVEYKTEQRIKEREDAVMRENAEREEQERIQKMQNAFSEREDRFKSRHKNYDKNAEAVMESVEYHMNEGVAGVPLFTRFIATSDVGPEIVHHLGENQHLIDDIIAKDDIGIIIGLHELGKTVSNSTTDKGKKLPEPVNKLRTTPDGSKSMVDMSYDELSKKLKL